MTTYKTTYRNALRDAMSEEIRRDEKVFLIGEEVAHFDGAYKCSIGMVKEFGDKRVVDTPISEYGFTGIAVGAAMKGLRPIVEFMSWDFSMQASDHIVNSAAKTMYMSGGKVTCPIVFRGQNAASGKVAAQHSQDFAAWYANVPGLKVVAPANVHDAKGLLKAAIRDNSPVVFLEHEKLYSMEAEISSDVDFVEEIGKAKVIKEGTDVTIIAYSYSVETAKEAALELEKRGVSAEVIDIRTIKPLDETTILDSVKKTSKAVVIQEAWGYSSVGESIAHLIQSKAFDYLDAPVEVFSGTDIPMPYAPNLEKLALPQAHDVVDKILTKMIIKGVEKCL
ncbi:MAG: pyruvate dehydrogenase complex E1 component subunit beta [Proteobacteria bacterium]|nr:pyruvate dehydrogenase complex E1 component subunit beta [Pseudomonadota bacterium]